MSNEGAIEENSGLCAGCSGKAMTGQTCESVGCIRYSDRADSLTQVIEKFFTYHPPKNDQVARYTEIRDAGAELARVILKNTPGCADQSAAIRKVREAVMTSNAAIACHE